MNDKEFIKYITKEENLIDDFENYLKENDKEITINWKINDKNILDYLKTLSIDQEIKYQLFTILNEYCDAIPF